MLGVLSARPKPWILASLFLQTAAPAAHQYCRLAQSISVPSSHLAGPKRRHSSACHTAAAACESGGAASIWHAILPSSGRRHTDLPRPIFRGEGSWNAACDARPARWLHRSDSAWMLFGVCACLSPVDWNEVVAVAARPVEKTQLPCDSNDSQQRAADYRVTGVLADGRCLFRAIAHSACLRNGEETPDDDRQRELADELRAKVVDELLRRREEIEWIIEGDFDDYIKRIQQPYVWGGEPELLMASHVIRTPVSVYMVERSSGRLVNIAKYGEEYRKDEETTPINVLFHGYGHYDILDSLSDQSYQKLQV